MQQRIWTFKVLSIIVICLYLVHVAMLEKRVYGIYVCQFYNFLKNCNIDINALYLYILNFLKM